MCLRRKCYFFLTDFGGGRDRLWEEPLLSSPLQGEVFWAPLQDTLGSGPLTSSPSPLPFTCIPLPEGRSFVPSISTTSLDQ